MHVNNCWARVAKLCRTARVYPVGMTHRGALEIVSDLRQLRSMTSAAVSNWQPAGAGIQDETFQIVCGSDRRLTQSAVRHERSKDDTLVLDRERAES